MAETRITHINKRIGTTIERAAMSTTGLPIGSRFYDTDVKSWYVWNLAAWTLYPAISATVDDLTILGSLISTPSFDQIGDATNKAAFSTTGVLTYSGSARPTRHITLDVTPVAYPDGGDNAGTVTHQHDNTNHRNFWRWSSGSANQDIDLVFSFLMPANFAAWTATAAFYIDIRSSSFAGHVATVTLVDDSGTADTGMNGASIIPDADNTWQTKTDLPTVLGAASEYLHLHIHLDCDTALDTLDIARVYFTYLATN